MVWNAAKSPPDKSYRAAFKKMFLMQIDGFQQHYRSALRATLLRTLRLIGDCCVEVNSSGH